MSILAEFILKLNSKKNHFFSYKLLIYIQLITRHTKQLIKNGLGHNTAALVKTFWLTEHADKN